MILKFFARKFFFLLSVTAISTVQIACDSTNFTAISPKAPINKPSPTPIPDDGWPPTGTPVPDPVIEPQVCDRSTLKTAAVGSNCPDNYGVFGIDDPSQSSGTLAFGTLACCPLPAADILTGSTVTRGNNCLANEIMVGNTGSDVNCRAINTARYQLRPAEVCYFGEGSSGRGSAPRCGRKGVIPSAFSAFTSGGFMGDDGCLNFPYGSLSVGQTGRDCDQQSARQLFTTDGQAVTMFK